MPTPLKSQAARDAQSMGYGNEDYWKYLDESAQAKSDYYKGKGEKGEAEKQLTQPLSEALKGNEGE